ncbi:MAG TPA: cupin-like domain-containing protein [Planctomycetota bacterium]|nr:cupin-like domain-containing protein [Planctomycetota bacterium]
MNATGTGSAAGTGRGGALLEIDAAEFARSFDRRPFLVGHRLATHELFALPRLVELAKRLPPKSVEYNAGDIAIGQDPSRTPQTGLSVEETIRRIEDCRSWLVLKNIEQDPEFRALLDACLDEVEAHSEAVDPGMCDREGFIFVSSPGSVTPYHMDPEQNFLLQVRGLKQVSLFDRGDRAVVSEEQIEDMLTGKPRNMPWREEMQAHGQVFELTPGKGLHFPCAFPHWVKNGPEVSISFSITFRTRSTERRAAVHAFNARLRRRGVAPGSVGSSPARDALKSVAERGLSRVERILRRRKG